MKIVRAVLGAVLSCGLTLAVTAAPASAHATLVESTPKADSTVEKAPTEAILTFSERLDEPSTQVAVVGPNGATVKQPEADIDGERLVQPLELGEPGEYTVSYHIVSADGHAVEGHVSFTTQRDGGAQLQESQAPSATESDTNADGGIGWGVIAAIVAAVAVVAGVIVFLVRPKRAKS